MEGVCLNCEPVLQEFFSRSRSATQRVCASIPWSKYIGLREAAPIAEQIVSPGI